MEDKGIRSFQQKRYEIIVNLINRVCVILQKKEIEISANNITLEIEKIFKKENINTKYLVTEQTIGRNKDYRSVWEKYKDTQKKKFITKREKANKGLEFSIRDKYDMLKQDYIELLDNYNYLITENKSDIKENDYHKLNQLINGSHKLNQDNHELSTEILTIIKELLISGSVVIIKKDESVIIKNLNIKDNNKIIIDKNKWNNM